MQDFLTAADVQAEFRKFAPGEVNPDGSLKTPSGWIKFAKEFSLHIEEIRIRDPLHGAGSPSPGIGHSKIVDDLERAHFSSKLGRSHVVVVKGTSVPGGYAHTVVVYGADRFRLCFMDPLSDPALPTDPALPGAIPTRPRGRSGRVKANWFCETYADFADGPRYLLLWK